MKYIILTIAAVTLLIACSSKKNAATEKTGEADLTGTWELREVQNGMMPTRQIPAGSGNHFQFTETTFEEFKEGKKSRSGTYHLVPDMTASETVGLQLPQGQFTRRIIFAKDTTEKTFIDLRGDTLEFVTGFFPVDAGSKQVYVKTKNNR